MYTFVSEFFHNQFILIVLITSFELATLTNDDDAQCVVGNQKGGKWKNEHQTNMNSLVFIR